MKGSSLGFERTAAKLGGIGFARIICVESRQLSELQQLLRSEAGIRIFGGLSGHRNTALHQNAERFIGKIRGSDTRGTLADERSKPDFFSLGAIDLFDLAEPDLDRRGTLADIERVGTAGTGSDGAFDKFLRNAACLIRLKHRGRLACRKPDDQHSQEYQEAASPIGAEQLKRQLSIGRIGLEDLVGQVKRRRK